ncbi:MAG: tyrosine-type recombinase/integrase [Gemmatimonadaceae bacterium]
MTQSKSTSKSAWHKTNGAWTLSLGLRGTRIRLFENRISGVYYRDVWIGGRKDRRSLHTRDQGEALRRGKALLSELLKGGLEEASGVVTLGSLWDRFRRESAAWLDNSDGSRKGDERSAKVLVAFFGEGRDVSTLSENDQTAFFNARLKGGITLADGSSTRPVRTRTAQADLVLLHAMLRWGTRVRLSVRSRLLVSNPLDGVRLAHERNALRPVATWDRFVSTRNAIAALRGESTDESVRARWLKIDLALVLAESTGRRLGSIRQLRWEDIDLSLKQIRWRAETDKKGKEWIVPIPDELLTELRIARSILGAITGWVFAAQRDSTVPMDRHLFDRWLSEAEKRAGLPKLKGGLWHPYRRKWATERKELPTKDVMAAGGWADADTLLQCYQQCDHESLLRVMNEPRKLRDVAS